MKHSMYSGILLGVICLANFSTSSHAASYKISWTGDNGYAMAGKFEHADTLTGMINGTHLENFSIEGFQNNASLGRWDMPSGEGTSSFRESASSFNFNFDTSKGTFLTGGRSDTPSGQLWNIPSDGGFGFFSGNSAQGVYVNGEHVGTSQIFIGSTVTTVGLVPSTLRADRIPNGPSSNNPGGTVVNPEPSTILLFGTGIGGLLAYRLRKQRRSTELR
ncbi:MAG: hypothetical protein NPIRA04_34370 [Nitrospirales bacterium]|nr:MAG: hypothetical protein NPIRA04_34370 [Nitrospirales bacterium]